MENPFETVEVKRKPRIKKNYTLDELFEIFPEESVESIELKKKISEKVKNTIQGNDFLVFKITQMLFDKYFYDIRYSDEQDIDDIIIVEKEFEMFKTI